MDGYENENPLGEIKNTCWSMSTSIGKLVDALAKAQIKFERVVKGTENPAYMRGNKAMKYADLAAIIEATREHLASEGLSVMQMPHAKFGTEDTKELTVTTLLAHSSGEWIATDLSLPAMMRERFDAQSLGSACTYGRRYALAAILNVAQEDDDGNKASGVGTKQAAAEVAKDKLSKAGKFEPVKLVPWKEGLLAITGNGLTILKAEMSADDKDHLAIKWNGPDKVWSIPLSQGNLFASFCEKYKVPCEWADSQMPEAD